MTSMFKLHAAASVGSLLSIIWVCFVTDIYVW